MIIQIWHSHNILEVNPNTVQKTTLERIRVQHYHLLKSPNNTSAPIHKAQHMSAYHQAYFLTVSPHIVVSD